MKNTEITKEKMIKMIQDCKIKDIDSCVIIIQAKDSVKDKNLYTYFEGNSYVIADILKRTLGTLKSQKRESKNFKKLLDKALK